MLNVMGPTSCYCDGVTRRNFLKIGAFGAGLTLADVLRLRSQAAAPLGAAGCQPASPSGAFPAEVYGTASGGTVWAWFMAAYPPEAGIEDKTVWRLDGPHTTGVPTFALVGPGSQQGHLNWGPEEHGGSSWTRPGRRPSTRGSVSNHR